MASRYLYRDLSSTRMSVTLGIIESLVAAAIVAVIVAAYKGWFGQQIAITKPRPGEDLTDPEPLGAGRSFPVEGTFQRVPKRHDIWLLVEDELTGRVWPQGFFHVQIDRNQQRWHGRVNAMGRGHIKIVVVIAPPTSQDYFGYFQMVGRQSENNFTPIPRVPPECTKRDSVQARVP